MAREVAVVTGAGSGIGRALACRLVAAGARFVVCTDIDADAARETANLIGSKASAEVLDVADIGSEPTDRGDGSAQGRDP